MQSSLAVTAPLQLHFPLYKTIGHIPATIVVLTSRAGRHVTSRDLTWARYASAESPTAGLAARHLSRLDWGGAQTRTVTIICQETSTIFNNVAAAFYFVHLTVMNGKTKCGNILLRETAHTADSLSFEVYIEFYAGLSKYR